MAETKLDKMKAQMKSIRTRATAKSAEMIGAAEVAGGAVLAGYIRGRYPERQQIMGKDTDLVVGTVLTLAGLADLAGKYDDDLINFGSGMLSFYLAREAQVAGNTVLLDELKKASDKAAAEAAKG